MAKNSTSIEVQGTPIKIQSVDGNDYICLTDIAKSKNSEHPDDLIRNWLRNRNTLELLGIWERLHNPKFNPVEFDGIRKQAGLNSFTLTPKQWIERLLKLNRIAIRQMQSLTSNLTSTKQLSSNE